MQLTKKFLYSRAGNLIFRSVLRPFSRLLPEKVKFPVTGRVRVRLPEGKTMRLDVNPTCYAGKVLFWNGYSGFESDQFPIFIDLIKQSEVFLDIGANIGYYSVLGGLYNSDVEIVSFEPLPTAYDYLRANCYNNRLVNVTPRQIALSDETGNASFFFSRNPKFDFVERQLTSTGSLDRDQANRTAILDQVDVRMMKLDDYVSTHQLPTVDLIKLDTEATEHLVLRGAKETLSRFMPVILCEVLPGRIEEELQIEFEMLKFDMYRADGETLVQVNTLCHGPETTNDYLFCHPEKRDLIGKYLA